MLFKNKSLTLATPQVMGILNVTPDSFSDGGKFTNPDSALRQAEKMIAEGASIIDIGGESTRPGAEYVSPEQELERVVPVIELLNAQFDAVLSVDTNKAQVMEAAVAAGAGLINDVNGLRGEGAVATAAKLDVPVCIMHMQGEPGTMQQQPQYDDVVKDITDFLQARVDACVEAGISRSNILIDPGFGFGKTLEHNCELLAKLAQFKSLALPMLIGVSRKSMFGALFNRDVEQRVVPSVVTAVLASQKGASILRVHDVKDTVDALKLLAISNND